MNEKNKAAQTGETNHERPEGHDGTAEPKQSAVLRKTKILCTIGPASRDEETLRRLFHAGMNAGRFNFSHGTYEEHEANIARFRKVRDELGLPGAVVLDTKGPEIRLKNFRGGKAELQDGDPFLLTTEDIEGNCERASVTYAELPDDVQRGDTILIDDGKIMLRVESSEKHEVRTTVLHGGVVKNHKGINIPDVKLNMPFLSERDKNDLLFGIEQGVDFVAASFTRNADDMKAMKAFLKKNGGGSIRVLAKIENTEGIRNFEEILKEADGIMIARGDMGVEVAFERLPGIQKRFTRRCVQSGKLVITATQMLESMIENPVPTRAEITDVANAVFEGTSAVMLSGETAAGSFPVEAVEAMAKIALQAEHDRALIGGKEPVWYERDTMDVTNAVGHAACTLAGDINAEAIMAITKTGFTARRTVKFRSDVPVIGATPEVKAFHQLSLEWGVFPLKTENKDRLLELYRHCAKRAVEAGLVHPGSFLVVTAGIPIGLAGDTNTVRVLEV